jgi:predicted DNA-binding transcriptional regulator AlpA
MHHVELHRSRSDQPFRDNQWSASRSAAAADINEVAALLGLSSYRIRQLVKADLFPVPLRIGLRNLAWTPADIEEFVNARRALAQEEQRQRLSSAA